MSKDKKIKNAADAEIGRRRGYSYAVPAPSLARPPSDTPHEGVFTDLSRLPKEVDDALTRASQRAGIAKEELFVRLQGVAERAVQHAFGNGMTRPGINVMHVNLSDFLGPNNKKKDKKKKKKGKK